MLSALHSLHDSPTNFLQGKVVIKCSKSAAGSPQTCYFEASPVSKNRGFLESWQKKAGIFLARVHICVHVWIIILLSGQRTRHTVMSRHIVGSAYSCFLKISIILFLARHIVATIWWISMVNWMCFVLNRHFSARINAQKCLKNDVQDYCMWKKAQNSFLVFCFEG